jgi:hypothetical protein
MKDGRQTDSTSSISPTSIAILREVSDCFQRSRQCLNKLQARSSSPDSSRQNESAPVPILYGNESSQRTG